MAKAPKRIRTRVAPEQALHPHSSIIGTVQSMKKWAYIYALNGAPVNHWAKQPNLGQISVAILRYTRAVNGLFKEELKAKTATFQSHNCLNFIRVFYDFSTLHIL